MSRKDALVVTDETLPSRLRVKVEGNSILGGIDRTNYQVVRTQMRLLGGEVEDDLRGRNTELKVQTEE